MCKFFHLLSVCDRCPIKIYTTEVVFSCGRSTIKIYATEVMFSCGRCPIKINATEVLFSYDRFPIKIYATEDTSRPENVRVFMICEHRLFLVLIPMLWK